MSTSSASYLRQSPHLYKVREGLHEDLAGLDLPYSWSRSQCTRRTCHGWMKLLRQPKKITSAAVVHIHEASKKYAIDHGVLRGPFGARSDEITSKAEIPIDFKSIDEELYILAQTGSCRRKVLTAIYANEMPRKSSSQIQMSLYSLNVQGQPSRVVICVILLSSISHGRARL